MCPCKNGRIGAFVTCLCICLALELGGLPSMLAQVKAGVPFAIGWAIFAGLGVLALAHGIFEALSHEDNFEAGSFLWSVCAIGLCGYGLTHHWYLTDGSSAQFSRALWFSWGASNLFGVWLNCRGQLRGRLRLPRLPVPEFQPQRSPRLALRRRRRIEVIEDIEGRGIDADDLARLVARHLGANTLAPPHASPVIEHDGGALPEIVYVPDRRGQLVPVRLPAVNDRVPR
jgi:hypothetical protein